MADAAIIGKYLGDVELAAVGGSATKIISMSINFFVGVSAGISSYVARYYGAKQMNDVKTSVYNGLLLFLVFTIVLSLLGVGTSEKVLLWMKTPTNTIPSALAYLNTYLYGLTACVIYNILSGILRAMGDSKSPFYVLVFTSILNITLDLYFILPLQWGVFGAAFATVLSQGISALVLLVILLRTLPKTDERPRLSLKSMKDIATLGLPAGAQSLMFGISNILIQTSINTLGVTAIAAWVAYIKIDSIVEIFVGAASATALTFVGQNYGAKKFERVNLAIKRIMQIGFALVASITVIFMMLRHPLISLFTNDPEIIDLGSKLMFIILPMYLITLPNQILSQALRGLGDTFIPMVLSVVGIIGIRVFWVMVVFPASPTLGTLGLCYPVGATILTVMFVVYYKHVQKKIHLI